MMTNGGCTGQSAVDACEAGVQAVELNNDDQYYGLLSWPSFPIRACVFGCAHACLNGMLAL